jgi:hypothetical protein
VKTIRKITVWRDKFVQGWDGEDESPIWHPTRSLLTALEERYVTDAHFVPYWIEVIDGESGQWTPLPKTCRVTLAALSRLHLERGRLRFGYGVADIDCPAAHRDGAGVSDEWRVTMRARAESLVPGCCHYDTRGGMRVIWAWRSPLDEQQHVGKQHAALDYLRANGLPADNLKDWGRCYRLPFVLRDGVKEERPACLREPSAWEAPETAAAQRKPGLWDAIDRVQDPFTLPDTIEQGERHTVLKRYAAQLRARGYNADEIEAGLREADLTRCNPPLQGTEEEQQIPDLVEWVCKFPAGTTAQQQATARHVPTQTADAAKIPAEAFDQKFRKGDPVEIADWVLTWLDHGTSQPCVADLGFLWQYEELRGLWKKITDKELNDRILAAHMMPVVQRIGKNGPVYSPLGLSPRTIDGVKDILLRRRDRAGFFEKSVVGVAFRDSFVQVDGNGVRFLPHHHENRCTVGYESGWTDALPTAFFAALEDYWRKFSPGDRADLMQTLGEWYGATLLGVAWRYKRIVWLYGESGDNGKSTVLNVVVHGMPAGTTTSILPQALGNAREVAALATSRLNVCDDISPKMITAEAAKTLKNLAGGDRMRGIPLYRSGFDFDSRCGVLLSMNTLPPTEDRSSAFFDRLLVFPFPSKISSIDRDFGKKLESERVQIVCWALRCAAALLKRGHYLENTLITAVRDEYAYDLDDVAQWLDDETEQSPHVNGITPSDAYSAYRLWAEKNGTEPITGRAFGKRIKTKIGDKILCGPAAKREWRYAISLRNARFH